MRWILLALLSLSCGPETMSPVCYPGAPPVACRARLTVTAWSEGFTPEEDASLRSGAAMWEAATGGAVEFEWAPDGRVRFLRGAPMPGMLGVVSGDTVLVDADHVAPGVGLAGVAAHELGHVLGVPHLTNPTALMYPTVHPCMRVTPADVAALVAHWAARGLP